MELDYQQTVLKYINGNKELAALFKYYITHCTSLCLPYHNMKHTFTMMYHIIQIFEHQKEYDINLSTLDLLVLLISALYHDYNHSGGLYSDDINISNAIAGFKNAINSVFTEYNNPMYDEYIIPCIRATQYPYIIEDKTLCQKIIRECDIISQISPDILTHVICGLKEENRTTKKWKDALLAYVEFIVPMLEDLQLQYCKDYWKTNSDFFFNIIKLTTDIIK